MFLITLEMSTMCSAAIVVCELKCHTAICPSDSGKFIQISIILLRLVWNVHIGHTSRMHITETKHAIHFTAKKIVWLREFNQRITYNVRLTRMARRPALEQKPQPPHFRNGSMTATMTSIQCHAWFVAADWSCLSVTHKDTTVDPAPWFRQGKTVCVMQKTVFCLF